MPDTSTVTTATAAETRAAGSKILGFILGGGSAIVDKLHDVANFVTKDAAGNVGVGTAAPATLMHLQGNDPILRVQQLLSNSTPYGLELVTGGQIDASFKSLLTTGEVRISAGRNSSWGGHLTFYTDTVERIRISSTGNVGVGTPSPIGRLHVNTNSTAESLVWAGNNSNGACVGMMGGNKPGVGVHSGSTFYITGSAGTTAVDLGVFTATGFGVGISSPAARLHVKSSAEIMRLETTTARGSGNGFLGFADPSGRKSFVGHASVNDDFYVLNEVNSRVLLGTNGAPHWVVENGTVGGHLTPAGDNSRDIGTSGGDRVRNIRLVNSPIVTSDSKHKMWLGSGFSAAELAAAKRIASEIGSFKWLASIAAEEAGGDVARVHFGVRAQQVWAIMAEEGLIDPLAEGSTPNSKYSFLCWEDWDATAPIDAVEEVRDEDDNIIVHAQPAQPGRDAGDRFGVRTDQLALFLIAAQEARLAALEAA